MDDPAGPSTIVQGGRRGLRRARLLWPLVLGATYLVVTVGVAALEYVSEMSKIGRGFYSDTFSPFLWVHLLTFPVSALHRDWDGYPPFFNDQIYRRAVRHALGPVLINIVGQAILLAAGLRLLVALWKRRHHGSPSE